MSTAKKRKSNQDSFSLRDLKTDLETRGWTPGLTDTSYRYILGAGFREKNLALACVATEIAFTEKPLTLRGLMYKIVSVGWLPSTDKEHYHRVGRILTTLREEEIVPFAWIVDSIRTTYKPSSWSGLGDFVETVQNAYRLDFWASLPEYVHIVCEKDAVAGTLQPTTRKYDVALSPIRGYASLSFAYEIASTWNQIVKPIHCYYVGDFDPSGFDLERDLQEKLRRYCKRGFTWRRLGVNQDDFDTFDLIPLDAKRADRRYAKFVQQHGHDCAELDAIPATELRRRVEDAITSHIPSEQWERLQEIERKEKSMFAEVLGKIQLAKEGHADGSSN